LISREDLQKIIESQRVPELSMAELSLIMKYADRGNKGYVATDKFIENLQELATETK
jgi:Ca2+-binding EF-hand superfamily protein